MVAVGISDALDIIGTIPWRQTVQSSINEHSQLEISAFRRLQPVQVPLHQCDVLRPRRSMYQSGGGIQHRLKLTLSLVINVVSVLQLLCAACDIALVFVNH